MSQQGPNNPNWQGGISANNMRYKRAQKARYPERVYARELVRRAVRSGRLVRGVCACGSVETFAHHEDYSKPLDVRWLCRACHRAEHEEHPQPKYVAPAIVPPGSFVWRGKVRPWKRIWKHEPKTKKAG